MVITFQFPDVHYLAAVTFIVFGGLYSMGNGQNNTHGFILPCTVIRFLVMDLQTSVIQWTIHGRR